MSSVLIQALQFVLALSLLVTIHELGHFLAARMFGIRVDKFYLFFNPWFSLYKRKIGSVEFGIGWLPLGGYVSIYDSRERLYNEETALKERLKDAKAELRKAKRSGNEAAVAEFNDAVATLETDIERVREEQRTLAPEPDELRAKPAWKRLIVMVAGVFMNLVAAMVIYAGILCAWGEDYLRNENVVHGYSFSEPAKELGFEDRDRILSIDNEAIGNAEEIGMKLLLSEADRNVTVVRNRDTVTFTIPMERLIAMREAREFAGMYTPIQLPYVVDGYSNEAVEALGYRVGDQIVAVDDVAACSGEVISPMLAERKGRVANVRVLRYETDSVTLAERPVYVEIATPINEEGMIGIMLKEQPAVEFTHVDYTFWESIPAGVKSGIREVKSYWDQLVMMVNPDTKLYKEVGGFLSIGSVFPDTWNWLAFWNITALISIMLAVMNLLPIPVLDGGHVLFALYEIVTRRKPNEKFLEVAQTIGFMLLMLLLIYANGNDIMNLFK